MRIAICFSGQLRTACHAAPAIKEWIGNLWDNCDFFIHTWDTNSYIGLQSDFDKHYYTLTGNAIYYRNRNTKKIVTPDNIKFLQEFYKPKVFNIESYDDWLSIYSGLITNADNYPPYYPPYYYSFNQSIKYKKKYEETNNFTYDLVIKLRPDVSFLTRKLNIYKDGTCRIAHNHVNEVYASHLCHDVLTSIKNSNSLYTSGHEELWMSSSETMDIISNIWDDYKLHILRYAELMNIDVNNTYTKNYAFHRFICQAIPYDDWHLIHLLQRMNDQGNFIDDIDLIDHELTEKLKYYLTSDKFLDLLYTIYGKL